MKPPFSPPAHMGKSKNASDSIDTFLTLMRTLEIVIMNRADFSKRQMENLEGKLSLYHSEAVELSSKYPPFLALISEKSDLVPAKVVQSYSKEYTRLAGEKVILTCFSNPSSDLMKMVKEKVGDAINRVYKAPLLTSSSNPSSDLCGDFFKTFELLECIVDYLVKFNRGMDLWLRDISAYMSGLMKMTLKLSSRVYSPSTDHNNNGIHGS